MNEPFMYEGLYNLIAWQKNSILTHTFTGFSFQNGVCEGVNPFLAESSSAKESVEVLHRQDDKGAAVLRRIVFLRPEHPVGNEGVGAA